MARSYATLDCGIWDDEDGFSSLSAGAQRTYFMLVSQRDIAACGVLALTLRRWGRTCSDKDVEAWLVELIDHGYVVVDEDTEEILVRTFVKWDGGYKHPQRLKAIHSSAGAIRSPALRTAMASEMHKLGLKPPPGMRPQSDPSPTREAIEPYRVGSEYVTTVHIPETSILGEEPSTTTAAGPLSPFCPKHPNGTNGPCQDCGTARTAYALAAQRKTEDEIAAKRAAAEARTACTLCDDKGIRIDPATKLPAGRCDHRRAS